MCGIVGYVGHRQALDVVLEGLRRLEYRGYDSSGVAVLDGGLVVEKRAGRIENLDKALAAEHPAGIHGTTGLGHTRWATHGAPTDRNAHPHLDTANSVAVIHNGIIENFAPLRAELEAAGIELRSETDTEVVAHLVAAELSALSAAGSAGAGGNLADAVRLVCRRLHGAFTLVIAHQGDPDRLVAARRNSPLVLGVGAGETFLASDVAAFVEHTRDAVELGQDQVVEITADGYTVTDFAGAPVATMPFRVDWDLAAAEKGGYPYFMLKEIQEQPAAVADTLLGRFVDGRIVLDEQRLDAQELRDVDKVFVVACGTAYHSGLIAKYAIEHWTRVPVEVEMASEFRYRDPVLDRDTLVVAISQSGETMDTLEAIRHAREQKARVLAVCNTNGAQIPRESDAVLYTRAGPEIGVASTKTFLAQIAATQLVGLALAGAKGTKYGDEVAREFAALEAMPALIAEVLSVVEPVRELARDIAGSKAVLFLGRHVGYPVALEGALKLKELAYMHAEGFPAGELKHGPIALIDAKMPVVALMPNDAHRERTLSN
ncbi:MAG TPA: glutamine--fructose-6-phosphate transaminase (isomerizing), partial [Mycobacteriales bacterium]|nr:glutamine--fructose-6-phosphate transaminase (isomerizing) [Mycobacteriales bacterium]